MASVTWHSGDTEEIVVTVTEDGVNVNSLAGATISFALYNAAGTLALSKTTGDFIASAPTFTCALADDDLDDLASGVYLYECRVTDSDGNSQSVTGDVYLEVLTL